MACAACFRCRVRNWCANPGWVRRAPRVWWRRWSWPPGTSPPSWTAPVLFPRILRHAGEYFRARPRDRTREVFACLADTRHRPIAMEELFHGTLDSSEVHPREVVKRALEHNAAAVLFAHNHPSGVAEPSAADRTLTHALREALTLVGVRVLDHFVIGDEVTSFAERGWL